MTDHKKINTGYVMFLALVSAMGGLLFGYDWVVIGGAKPFYERYFDITSSATFQGFAMSSALFGCIIGAAYQEILRINTEERYLCSFQPSCLSSHRLVQVLLIHLLLYDIQDNGRNRNWNSLKCITCLYC